MFVDMVRSFATSYKLDTGPCPWLRSHYELSHDCATLRPIWRRAVTGLTGVRGSVERECP